MGVKTWATQGPGSNIAVNPKTGQILVCGPDHRVQVRPMWLSKHVSRLSVGQMVILRLVMVRYSMGRAEMRCRVMKWTGTSSAWL